MLLGTHRCCCCVDEDVRGCCGVDEDVRGCCGVGEKRGCCCCGRRWEIPSSFASMAATLALENGDVFGEGPGLAATLKLGEEEEEGEAGLLSANSTMPKLRLIFLNQSLRNFSKKSTLTFSPFSSALPETSENFSLTL